MIYYFGKVPSNDVTAFGSDGLFEHEGDYYYNKVEVGSNPGGMEDFVLSDTCGRSIPISTDLIPGLGKVLLDIQLSRITIANGKEVEDNMFDSEVVTTFE